MHGGGGDMTIQSNDKYYQQIKKSESEGFIALFPNGHSQFQSGKLATWNAGKCCGKARDTKSDDVAFIKAAIEKTKTQLTIDSKRIFATGMSNGGMMSYRLACELPDMFRAIAAVAGTDITESCKGAKPVSVLHIHAKDDDHVLFEGGAGKNAFKDRSQVTEFSSVASTIEKWRAIDGCEAKPKRILDKKGAYCDRFETCKSSTRVQLCVTDSGGHSWPGGKKPSSFAGGSDPSTAISANDVMWDFFNGL
jgi:polyhydroxybutyrate depolymerase